MNPILKCVEIDEREAGVVVTMQQADGTSVALTYGLDDDISALRPGKSYTPAWVPTVAPDHLDAVELPAVAEAATSEAAPVAVPAEVPVDHPAVIATCDAVDAVAPSSADVTPPADAAPAAE